MKIVLLAFIDEFDAFRTYLQEKGLNSGDFSIVALEPVLQVHLTKLGVDFKNTLPYFNNDSHKRIIVETEKVMQFIRERFSFIDSNGLSNAYKEEFALYIRIYLNHLYKLIEIIANIYNDSSDCEIYAYVKRVVCADSWLITDDERYHGLLAMALAESRNARFVNINVKNSEETLKKRRRKSKGKGCKKLERLFTRCVIWAISDKKVILLPNQYHSFKNLFYKIGRKGIVLLSFNTTKGLLPLAAYNLISFLCFFIFKKSYQRFIVNINFIYSTPKNITERSTLTDILDDIVDSATESIYTYRGINCLDFVKQKVNTSFRNAISQMLRNSHNISYLFQKIKKKLVISDSAGDISAIAGELGKITGTQCLLISHGTHPVPIDVYHEMELYNLCKRFMLSDYSHIAISTPVQERHLHYFKQKYREIKNYEIKTGPLIFSSLSAKNKKNLYKRNLNISEDTFVITHAVTVKKSYFDRYYFIETLDEFFSSLTDVVNEVNKIDKCLLFVRIHPGFYLNDEEIKNLLPESKNYILHRDGSFSDVLGVTDLLVSYSSTTIDEALINRIPVLLYDKWNRYNHFGTTVYNESLTGDIFPVCYVNNMANLGSAFSYMMRKVKTTKKEDINVKSYSYDKNYNDALFVFIKDSLGFAKN